ncbi:hypothetical protein Tco_1158406, partial [Tanacetum coccineum]
NKFVPTAFLTRSGRIPVSTAKQYVNTDKQYVNTAKQYVNTATPKNRVNVSKSITNAFHKSHSPIRRPFYKSTVLNTRVSKEKVNNVRVNGVNTPGQTTVSTVMGNRVTATQVSSGLGPQEKLALLSMCMGNPQQALKYKGMFDSGCSRHMTGNKALLTDYQDINGGFVGFGGSTRGGIAMYMCIGVVVFEGRMLLIGSMFFKCWLYTTQQMVINSPCLIDKKELAIPWQTATGKEFSKLLMADSLPKLYFQLSFWDA